MPSGERRERGDGDQPGHFSQVLGGSEKELVPGAAGTAKAQAMQPEDAFKMREQHLDLLPFASRGHVGVGSGDVAGDIPGGFMEWSG